MFRIIFFSFLGIRSISKRLVARCLTQVPLYGDKTTVVISLLQAVSTEMVDLLSHMERLLITVGMSEASKFRNHIFFLIFCWPCISIYLFININQLDALNFYNKFISSLYMFRAHVLIVRRANCIIQSLVLSYLCTGRPPISVMIPETV